MNVASLELCKELYELTRWGGANPHASYESGLMWYYGDNYEFLALDMATWVVHKYGRRTTASGIPAYDADFLCDKLRDYDFTIVNLNHETLSLTSDSLDEPEAAILGRTLAEVLCVFSIELAKANLTPKEGGKVDATNNQIQR